MKPGQEPNPATAAGHNGPAEWKSSMAAKITPEKMAELEEDCARERERYERNPALWVRPEPTPAGPNPTPVQLLTIPEAAAALGLKPETVYRQVQLEKMAHTVMYGRKLVSSEAVEAYRRDYLGKVSRKR